MKALLVNDDGIHAEGLAILKTHLEKYMDVYVVAPLHEQSAKNSTINHYHWFSDGYCYWRTH